MDINDPDVITYMNDLTNKVTSNIPTYDYFTLSDDEKSIMRSVTFKFIFNSSKEKLNDNGLKNIILILWKKSVSDENYELSSLLKDIVVDFDDLSTKLNSNKKTIKSTEMKK